MLTPRKKAMKDAGSMYSPPVGELMEDNNAGGKEEELEDWEVEQNEDLLSECSGIDSGSNDGILIVSGEDDESNDDNAVDMTVLFKTAAALSLPGTDCSVPTYLESIDVTYQRVTSANNFLDNHKEQTTMVNGSSQTEHNTPIFGRLFKVAAMVVAMVVVISVTWTWTVQSSDQNMWRDLALSQQDELFMIKNELTLITADLAKAKNDSKAAMNILSNLQTENIQVTHRSTENVTDGFDWEEKEDNAILLSANNCWFKAEANFKLGDCASDAKDGLGCLTTSVVQAFEGLGKAFWDTAVFLKEVDTSLVFDGKPLQAGITLDGFVEVSNAIASATVVAADAMWNVVAQASQVMDETILFAVEQTRDAIEEATYTMRAIP